MRILQAAHQHAAGGRTAPETAQDEQSAIRHPKRNGTWRDDTRRNDTRRNGTRRNGGGELVAARRLTAP